MPFFKAAGKLVYYAHVPKCGGTSVASYLAERFGPLAFHDRRYLNQPEAARWTRSSPQHVDAATLERLIPLALFDACFTIVRHPVARIVSIYHFQQELEASIPSALGFSDWLGLLEAGAPDDPFRYDNHTRPMSEIVPEGAAVFHMEHGLDRLIPWCDLLTGDTAGPRALLPENTKGQYVTQRSARIVPTAADLARIARLYATDFARFGYLPGSAAPISPAPQMTEAFVRGRNRALRQMNTPLARLRRKIRRRLR